MTDEKALRAEIKRLKAALSKSKSGQIKTVRVKAKSGTIARRMRAELCPKRRADEKKCT